MGVEKINPKLAQGDKTEKKQSEPQLNVVVFYLKIACDQRRKIFKISLTLFINTWLVVVVQHSRVALAQCTLSRKREELSWKRGGRGSETE